MSNPQHKLAMVRPEGELTARQKAALEEIEKQRRERAEKGFKSAAYKAPEIRSPVLQRDEISRSATKQITVPRALPWWKRLAQRLSK